MSYRIYHSRKMYWNTVYKLIASTNFDFKNVSYTKVKYMKFLSLYESYSTKWFK